MIKRAIIAGSIGVSVYSSTESVKNNTKNESDKSHIIQGTEVEVLETNNDVSKIRLDNGDVHFIPTKNQGVLNFIYIKYGLIDIGLSNNGKSAPNIAIRVGEDFDINNIKDKSRLNHRLAFLLNKTLDEIEKSNIIFSHKISKADYESYSYKIDMME